jgi:glycosyltransferase involved in cell wall biosynthesis
MRNSKKLLVLTNAIVPHLLPLFQEFRNRVGTLRIYLSARVEPNRHCKPDWRDLDVDVQRCWTFKKTWRHEQGFAEDVFVHIPYDTLPLLWGERPDVVISAQLGLRTVQAALYKRLRPRTRLIIWTGLSEHTEKGLSAVRTRLRSWILRQADAVIVDGASGMRYLMSLGVPRAKIFVFHYGIEPSPFIRLPLKRGPAVARRLLYSGRLVELKGLTPFLEVLSSWLRDHAGFSCELWLVGDGPLRRELEAFPAPPSLRLRFLGNVEYAQLPEVYSEGGILAFPSLSDEWGMVVNEALASGMPILGSLYSQAVDELIKDGVHGWTFRPDHAEEMYRAIDCALTISPERLDEMRRAGRERIRNVTVESSVTAFLKAIEFACSTMYDSGEPSAETDSCDHRYREKVEVPTS